ncbi:LIC_10190 family membrane protein [Spirosoma endbachense]|uniref:DUF8201 domain-containing protein n=1 Tax=Spirosoma endbachense TaxID=2666025 RepID=A0A6P1VQW2_9BACT|nr:hypothetical protein [Spirosoma endbachense]QHV94798.1 hypothetical protein GJR95_07110 [Spirosoma endbachense]
MLILLLLWALLYILLSVLGEGIVLALQRHWPGTVSPTETVLMGLMGVISVLQIVSIFFPTNCWFVAGLALLAIFINWQLANRPIRAATTNFYKLVRQPVVWLLIVVILVYAIGRPVNPDSGTYHLPTIRYVERYAAIPGLGNLFSRLAFNSSFFVIGAAFGFTDLAGQTLFPLNGFLLLLFGDYSIRQLQRLNLSPVLRNLQLSIVCLALFFLIRQVNAPGTDVWATLLTLFVFLVWLNENRRSNHFRAFLLVALVFTCLTVKLATLPILLLLPFVAYEHRHWIRWNHGVWVTILACLLIGPWLVRNVILSGYLIFPFTELDLVSVDWKVAKNAVRFEHDFVTFWARFHLPETKFDPEKLTWPFARWVSWWWTHWWFWYNWPNRPTFIMAVLSPVLMASQWVYGRERLRGLLAAYVVALAGFLFWFLKAPEFRFGYAFIWIAALLPILNLIQQPLPTRIATGLVGLTLIGLLVFAAVNRENHKPDSLVALLLIPAKLSHLNSGEQNAYYDLRRTRSGLAVVVPRAPCEACFDIELPCTPFFSDDLQLRGKTIAEGFRLTHPTIDSLAHNSIQLPAK